MSKLEKAHKQIQRERLINDVIRKCDKDIIARTQMSCLAACVQVLHDKFGFGKRRLSEYMMYVYDYFDSIYKEYVSFDDIKECIYDELGIDFNQLEREQARYFRERGIL